jgi:hypothetical protein
MSLFHAVAFVDHQSAEVLQFASEHVVERKVHEHLKFKRFTVRHPTSDVL